MCVRGFFFLFFSGDLEIHFYEYSIIFLMFFFLLCYICSDLIYILDVTWIFLSPQQLFSIEFKN